MLVAVTQTDKLWHNGDPAEDTPEREEARCCAKPEPQPQPQGAVQGAVQGALMEASQRPRPGSRADGPGDPWLSQRGPEQQMSEARRRQLAVLRQ